MIFDVTYFESTLGSVHTHEHSEYWANRILREFGRCRVLDCGAGCGHLVKTLCEQGCEAWGIDISDHAVANSCSPGRVIRANVTEIPFKDDFFDLVFSNGLWAYLTEAEIAKARGEIWRVGREQLHNIDHSGCDYLAGFETWRPLDWWQSALAAPKVLVSCPTHESKEYAHEAWLEMAGAIDYPNCEVFVVDNSPTRDCSRRWGFDWLGDYDAEAVKGDQCQRMASSMEIARRKFLDEDFAYWFNVEIDVIPAPPMLKTLLRIGKGADWTAHTYPPRGGEVPSCSGVGCSIWGRRLIEGYSFTDHAGRNGNGVDSVMWEFVRPLNKYRTVEAWSYVPIKHLKEPERCQ